MVLFRCTGRDNLREGVSGADERKGPSVVHFLRWRAWPLLDPESRSRSSVGTDSDGTGLAACRSAWLGPVDVTGQD